MKTVLPRNLEYKSMLSFSLRSLAVRGRVSLQAISKCKSATWREDR